MVASERVEEILKLVAAAQGVPTYELSANKTVFNGDGVGSECFRGVVKSEDPEKTIQVFIKMKPPRPMQGIEAVFIVG